MTTTQLLALLLAFSAALHLGVAAALTAWRGGTPALLALLVGGGATGGAFALYVTAVSAYRS